MTKHEFICNDNKNAVVKYIICDGNVRMVTLDKFYFTLFPPEVDRANEVYARIWALVSAYTLANKLYTKDQIEEIILSSNGESFKWNVKYVESWLDFDNY